MMKWRRMLILPVLFAFVGCDGGAGSENSTPPPGVNDAGAKPPPKAKSEGKKTNPGGLATP